MAKRKRSFVTRRVRQLTFSGSRKRRKSTRRNRLASPRVARGVQQQLFPNKKRIVHRYVETVTIDPGASGILESHNFATNGLFDPNLTGAGHQPLMVDTFFQYYTKGTVIGSKMTAWFQPTSTTTLTVPYAMGIFLDQEGNSTMPTIFEHLREAGPVKMKTGTFGTGANQKVVTCKWSCKRSKSVTNPLDEPNLASIVTANATSKSRFIPFCGPVNGSTNMGPVQVTVQIDYVVIWTDPIPIELS